MRIILSRRDKRFNDISKEVSAAMKTKKGSLKREKAFKKFYREIAMDYGISYLCGEHRMMPDYINSFS